MYTDDPQQYEPFLRRHGFYLEPGDIAYCRCEELHAARRQHNPRQVRILGVDTGDPELPYLVSPDLDREPTVPDDELEVGSGGRRGVNHLQFGSPCTAIHGLEWHSGSCLKLAVTKVRLACDVTNIQPKALQLPGGGGITVKAQCACGRLFHSLDMAGRHVGADWEEVNAVWAEVAPPQVQMELKKRLLKERLLPPHARPVGLLPPLDEGR